MCHVSTADLVNLQSLSAIKVSTSQLYRHLRLPEDICLQDQVYDHFGALGEHFQTGQLFSIMLCSNLAILCQSIHKSLC